MTIRIATPDDEDAVRGCAESAYRQYVAAIGKKPAPMVADFGSRISQGKVHVAVDDEATVIGFIAFFPRGDHMFLENVAVLDKAAGHGVGKALIGFCEAEARRLSLPSVRLYTNEKMTRNLVIYPRLGYVETDRREEDGFNRVYFEKPVS